MNQKRVNFNIDAECHALLKSVCALKGVTVSDYVFKVLSEDFHKLIRENNSSAAIAFSGSLMGFSLPIAIIIAHSSTLMSCLVWGIVALLTQIVVFFIARLLIPGMPEKIENGELASGIWLGMASLTGGIVNAACMTY